MQLNLNEGRKEDGPEIKCKWYTVLSAIQALIYS